MAQQSLFRADQHSADGLPMYAASTRRDPSSPDQML